MLQKGDKICLVLEKLFVVGAKGKRSNVENKTHGHPLKIIISLKSQAAMETWMVIFLSNSHFHLPVCLLSFR